MTPDALEIAVCNFVEAAVSGLAVVRRSRGSIQRAGPYAVVGIVSDEQGGPTDTVDGTGDNVSFSGHRRFRAQVDVIGTETARAHCQRIAVLWQANSAAARAAVTAGIGPQDATGLRDTTAVRGGVGPVVSAAVDLLGWHRAVYGDEAPQGSLVETITGTQEDGATGTEYTWSETVDPPA